MDEIHTITFYPVGNGDTVQLVLNNGRRVLFDFCQKSAATDEDSPEMDIAKHLREELHAANTTYFDVVAFTHADKDHIQGSTNFFELRHSRQYQGEGRIQVAELWVPAAMLLEEAEQDEQKEDFVLWRQEARHRLLEGEGILVFSKPVALRDWLKRKLEDRGENPNARNHLFVDAGAVVPTFSLTRDRAEFFCHSPFIRHTDDGDVIRNRAALAFNVRIAAGDAQYQFLEIGDADSDDIEDIVATTESHSNADRLEWDLFNIPHHCSYKALNVDEKGDHETAPKQRVADLLRRGHQDAYIVSCSQIIPDEVAAYESIQPPHRQARNAYERYLNEIGGRKFLVTMEEPNHRKPEPIVFEISSEGISWSKSTVTGAPAIVASTPPRAGL